MNNTYQNKFNDQQYKGNYYFPNNAKPHNTFTHTQSIWTKRYNNSIGVSRAVLKGNSLSLEGRKTG